ncbi:Protein C16C8.2 [Aphelenchoides avenae]|nr:Protein C16C8.2 [Aphelenchus avenae]
MFNNTLLLRYGVDDVLRGLLMAPAKKPQSMAKDVTERLFGRKDLDSTNIQRGRDHHIPGYASVRNNCGLGRVRSFDDLKSVVANRDAIGKLKQVNPNVGKR